MRRRLKTILAAQIALLFRRGKAVLMVAVGVATIAVGREGLELAFKVKSNPELQEISQISSEVGSSDYYEERQRIVQNVSSESRAIERRQMGRGIASLVRPSEDESTTSDMTFGNGEASVISSSASSFSISQAGNAIATNDSTIFQNFAAQQDEAATQPKSQSSGDGSVSISYVNAVDKIAESNNSDSSSGGSSSSSSSSGTSATASWDISSSASYVFNSAYITLSGGKAVLQTVDQAHDTSAEFNSGTRVGTTYSGGALKLDSATGSDTSFSSSWTPGYSSLKGYWKFEGDFLDSSGNANHGVAVGAANTAVAQVGTGSARFNDSASFDYVEIANSGSIENITESSYTFMAWYKPESAPQNANNKTTRHCIIGKTGWNTSIAYEANKTFLIHVVYMDPAETQLFTPSIRTFEPGVYYHVAGVVDWSARTAKIYVDGVLQATGNISATATPRDYGTGDLYIGTCSTDANVNAYAWNADGWIDDAAVFSTALSASDISTIYHRQKQKYAGHFDSPVMDMGRSSVWTTLSSITSLPFFKELTSSTGTESAASYASLASSLSNQLVGVWHHNETAGLTTSDLSGNGTNGTVTNGAVVGRPGLFGNALYFDGTDDYVSFPAGTLRTLLSGKPAISASAWVKYESFRSFSQYGNRIFTVVNGGVLSGFSMGIRSDGGNEGKLYVLGRSEFGEALEYVDTSVLDPGKWYHVVGITDYANDKIKIYINGTLATDTAVTFDQNTLTTGVGAGDADAIGCYAGDNTSCLQGYIDEVAVWGRALTDGTGGTPNEILELYRRGANRLKFQVRTCDDAACDTETWKGPDGTGTTYFSELHNYTSISAAGVGTGAVQSGSLSLNFVDFTAAGLAVSNNQYFQYRAFFESDDENALCSAATCVPELTSVTIGPTGRYYGGSPTISNSSPVTFTSLSSILFTSAGTCTPTYQVSKDGSTYYYWTGSAWATASSGASQSSVASDVQNNIGTFSTTVGAGSFYFRAYLNSDGSQSCELDQVDLSYTY